MSLKSENTTKMVEETTRKRGSESLFAMLPKHFVRQAHKTTGFSEKQIANELKGVSWGNADFIDMAVRVADLNLEFQEKINEELKPFKNAKSNKNRI